MIKIRAFTPTEAEYDAVLKLRNSIQPDNPSSVAIWRYWDDNRQPEDIFHRYVIEADGRLVGYGQLGETSAKNGAFFIEAHIHPAYQGGRLTRQLYDHLLTAVLAYKPRRLLVNVRENETVKLHWLSQNGFHLGNRYPVSRLDVAHFDPAPFSALLGRVAAQGIEIIPLSELADRDPDWQRRVYDLDYALMSDVLLAEPYPKRPFSQFVREEFEHPNFLPGGWFVGLDGETYAGMSALVMLGQSTRRLGTALTGVLPSYRRRGIATASKVHSISFAKSLGAETIEAGNEANNPMFQINLRLGFKPLPAWLDFERNLGQKSDS